MYHHDTGGSDDYRDPRFSDANYYTYALSLLVESFPVLYTCLEIHNDDVEFSYAANCKRKLVLQ